MDFREKIDKLLEIKGIKLYKLAEISGLGNTLEKAYEDNRNMRTSTTERFLHKLGINEEWWETGIGDVFLTSVDNPTDNKEISMTAKETFWREVMEDTDHPYRVVPSSVFKDYKIVPDKIIDVIIRSNESEKIALNEKYELMIQGLKNRNSRLETENQNLLKEIEDLRRQIPGKTQ
jgi:hypothetical protein